MRRLLLALALAAALPARAAGDFDGHVAQARHFAKKGWYADAAAEVRAALATQEGRNSWEAHWLAAQVAWEVLDVEWALAMARDARRLAPDPEKREQADALVESYEQGFGFLTVRAPYPGMATRMQLEARGPLIDPELKRYVNRCALRWRERTPLPARVGLPVGAWLVNGQEVVVEAGKEATLSLPMNAMGARGLAALQVTRAEISGGIGFFLGERAADMSPAPTLAAAVTFPIGPVLLGIGGDFASQGYLDPDNQVVTGGIAWAAGIRAGAELPTRLPIAIRPSLGARYLRTPGIPLDCTEGPEGWACAAPGGSPPPARVYAIGQALAPGGELLLEYRQAGRTTAFGTGFLLRVDQAFGSFPEGAGGDVHRDLDIDWTAAGERWTATGVHLLANVSFAF